MRNIAIATCLLLASACGESGPTEDSPDAGTEEHVHKGVMTPEQAARYNCKQMNRYFGPGGVNCSNTQGPDFLAWADGSCDHQVNVMPAACHDEFAEMHYWGKHYFTRPYPQLPYGDAFDWICINGWAVLLGPPYSDDTQPLRDAFYGCVGPGW